MTSLTLKRLNPWLSIWVKPRQTIQQIVDANHHRLVLFLTGLAGTIISLSIENSRNPEYILVFLFSSIDYLPFAIILQSILFSILGLYVYGNAIESTGDWLDGKATGKEIRTAIAWSNVPIISTLPLLVIQVSIHYYRTFILQLESNLILTIIFIFFGIIQFIAVIWSFLLFLQCLGQVQGFSVWKALGNSLLAGLTVIIVLFIIFGTFAGIIYLLS